MKEYPDVLYDLARHVKEAQEAGEPYMLMIVRPDAYFYGTHNPNPDKPLPLLEPNLLEATLMAMTHRIRHTYIRDAMNMTLDKIMVAQWEEAIEDVEQRIEEDEDYQDIEEWGDDI